MTDEEFNILVESEKIIKKYKNHKNIRRIILYPFLVITSALTLKNYVSLENFSTRTILACLTLIFIIEHLEEIINLIVWIYKHIATPFGESMMWLYRVVIKLIIYPIVSDYEAREYNYQQIIKKQQQELASIDPKYTSMDLIKTTGGKLKYRIDSEKDFKYLYDEKGE